VIVEGKLMKIEKISTSERKMRFVYYSEPRRKISPQYRAVCPGMYATGKPVGVSGSVQRTASGPLMSSPKERTSGLVETDFRASYSYDS
jgi:hypothetical protein